MGKRVTKDRPVRYQIRLAGHLDTKWSAWFDDFTIEHGSSETTLTGIVQDQAALHGILARIRDLGLTLLCVKRLEAYSFEGTDTVTGFYFPKIFPEIETERLILRKITSEDTEAIFRNFSDPEIACWFFEHPLKDFEQARQIIEQFNAEFKQGKGLTWAVALKKTLTCIGTCGYGYVEVGNKGEIGFDLAKEYWNQGMMTECLEAIIEYGFSTLGLLKIEAHTFSNNDRARRLLEKLGFHLDHISEDSHYYFLSQESA